MTDRSDPTDPIGDDIRRALGQRAEVDLPALPSLDRIEAEADAEAAATPIGQQSHRCALAVAAVLVAIAAIAGGVAWLSRSSTTKVLTGGPGRDGYDVPDPATLAYLPGFVSDLADDVSKEVSVEQTPDGYVLTATTTTGGYTFTFDRSTADPDGSIGTSAAFADGIVDLAGSTATWTDAVGTVTYTGTDVGEADLERIATSTVLVDAPTFDRFLADPTAPVRGTRIPLVFSSDDTDAVQDVGVARWSGEIAGDGVLLDVEGEANSSASALLGVRNPFELAAWTKGNTAWLILRVPADYEAITFPDGHGKVFGRIDDPSVGPLLLLRTDTLDPVDYRITFSGATPDESRSMCVPCGQ